MMIYLDICYYLFIEYMFLYVTSYLKIHVLPKKPIFAHQLLLRLVKFQLPRQGTTSGEEKRMVCYFFVMACICGLGGIMVQTFGQMGVGWMTSKCTYKGPWSHQIWPVLNMQYHLVPGILGSFLGKMLSAGNLFLYMISSLGGFLSSRPSYVLPTLAAIGLNAQFLILFLGPEWGSFWCFQASLLSCVALLEPYFFKTFGEINAFAPKKSPKSQSPVDERSTTLGVELDALVDDEQTSTIP